MDDQLFARGNMLLPRDLAFRAMFKKKAHHKNSYFGVAQIDRIPINLPRVVDVIDKTLKGKLHRSRSKIVRKITIRSLSQQGCILKPEESSAQIHEARKHCLEGAMKKLDDHMCIPI